MIDFKNQTAGPNTSSLRPFKPSIWYKTPVGLINTLKEAIEWATAHEYEPGEVIETMVVAVTDDGYVEVIK